MDSSKAHAVIIPYPAQGHITPMLQLAKFLHYRGFFITFVNTEYNHRRMVRSQNSNSFESIIKNFRFEAIPDGMPQSDLDVTQDIPKLCLSTRDNCGKPLKELIYKLNTSAGVPQVSCIVADNFMSFTLDVAKELGIVELVFFTMSACGCMCYIYFDEVVKRGYTPLKARPHAVLIPGPAQGHISPMLQLAKFLHYRGFFITFVNTEYNHRRMLRSQNSNSFENIDNFRFEAIPDGLLHSNLDVAEDVSQLTASIRDSSGKSFKELINKLNSLTGVPRVSCIIADNLMSFTLEVAKELGIVELVFFTMSACGCLCYIYFDELYKRGYTPLKDESCLTNGYLDTTIDWIPSMKGIRLKDFPTFVRTTDPNDIMFNFDKVEAQNAFKSSGIIINTFDSLEHEVIQELKSMFPHVYTLGPLPLFLTKLPDCPSKSVASNLWKEDMSCLEWLDLQDSKSVVYVNFGSITVMTAQQLEEFAWGLANSKHKFLWVIRPDMVNVENGGFVSEEFIEETKDRGILVNWCPQEKVLLHFSVGAFLTHSGWNSTLESICGGVPMICWPFFSEQTTNCRYVCEKWNIGVEISSNVKREEVEELVKEMMEGENGKTMRAKANEWKMKAEESVKIGGSSYENMEKLEHDLQTGTLSVCNWV